MGVTKRRIETSTNATPVAACANKKTKHDKAFTPKIKAQDDDTNDDTVGIAAAAGGLDEIESLFADKKKKQQQQQEVAEQQRKMMKGKKKHASIPPSQNKQQQSTSRTADWVEDGLGGKYNSEGFTGRIQDGMKVFKTHLLQSKKSGTTPECPFDCNCCFI
jgi:Eukaryotic protein of unknown function (DUF1764)